ncbi:Calcium/calmodulin-dependent 3',5'-cyclic nucleotide phosphodiesterase 1C [Galemys pyrenaicus]|uniref:Calcium/calmodulin-dependent 3',5'-cyclic nucleotide phosphodiesterase 1C n=1 Tax=Galemys pyrenaicus TaxID=202257 RepID=A0A8J6AEG3_GALPY|nr:Calcium/calmodulin-dependent 3',5'-cyclic nucleotide phosphodiesterase 1C [Galemys pyrenaicus]
MESPTKEIEEFESNSLKYLQPEQIEKIWLRLRGLESSNQEKSDLAVLCTSDDVGEPHGCMGGVMSTKTWTWNRDRNLAGGSFPVFHEQKESMTQGACQNKALIIDLWDLLGTSKAAEIQGFEPCPLLRGLRKLCEVEAEETLREAVQ